MKVMGSPVTLLLLMQTVVFVISETSHLEELEPQQEAHSGTNHEIVHTRPCCTAHPLGMHSITSQYVIKQAEHKPVAVLHQATSPRVIYKLKFTSLRVSTIPCQQQCRNAKTSYLISPLQMLWHSTH